MRIVIINHCHPREPHVCGTRGWEFARALAAMDHQVIVLTSALGSDPVGVVAGRTEALIDGHDWREPLLVPIKPYKAPILDRARLGKLPKPINKLVSAWAIGVRQSPFYDWTDAAQPILREIRWAFEPEIVWGIYGNAGCWVLARDLARQSGCPWVGDGKDGFITFTPSLLFGLQVKRFENAMAFTALAQDYADQIKRSFGRDVNIVYSGITPALAKPPLPAKDLSITMAGSLYGDHNLSTLSEGLRQWVAQLPQDARQQFRLNYFGGETERFANTFDWCEALTVRGFVPLEELLEVQRTSWVNIFTKAPGIYHHKLIELLAAGRPVLAIPEASEEDLLVTARTGGTLEVASDAGDIVTKLNGLMVCNTAPEHYNISPFLWPALAEELEKVFVRARS